MSEPRDADSVAARLRILRGSLGLSQEQLARRLGVSFATVNRWESGRTQLSARAAAALAALEAGLAGTSQRSGGTDALPVAQTSFVGRARELAELARLIRQSRLVTLIGPGGAGKTRLAAEVLGRSFADSDIVFVPLEQIRYPRSLASSLASQLKVVDQQGTPLTELLAAALAAGPKLLLLDGAERIADQVAELSNQLLAGGTRAQDRRHQPGGTRHRRRGVLDGAAARLSLGGRRGIRHRRIRCRAAVHGQGERAAALTSARVTSRRTPSPSCAVGSMACRWPSS